MTPKQRAAEAVMRHISSGMRVGLGTGSTADFFLAALASALRDGKLDDIAGVPTSIQSEQRARELGIPLTTLDGARMLDVTVDGADEISPKLDVIKGRGGALLREKIVAQNSRLLIIVADADKRVENLGERSPLPVEVVQFSHRSHEPFLRSLGSEPVLRIASNGAPFVTDNGNFIYDCRFARIDNAAEIEMKLMARAGVVATGFFLGIASLAMIADEKGVQELRR